MEIKHIDQVVMLTGDGRFVFVSDFSNIGIAEFVKSDISYKEVRMDGYEPAFCINPPKTLTEVEKFIEIFYPDFTFIMWWSRTYGNNNWRKMHGIPMTRRKR